MIRKIEKNHENFLKKKTDIKTDTFRQKREKIINFIHKILKLSKLLRNFFVSKFVK